MKESLWQRLSQGVRRLQQRHDSGQVVEPNWPDRIMGLTVTDHFHAKQGRSTGRFLLHTERGLVAVYLKRYFRLPRWRGLLASVWPDAGWSPGVQEYRHLEWARAQGVPVPATVAAGEYIGPWGRLQSFLAVEELTGMLPLHEIIPLAAKELPPSSFRRWKRGLTLEMARLAKELHQRRHFHKDLYLCHFFASEQTLSGSDAWRGQVSLIDFHRLGHHPWTWRLYQMKDLAQLWYSSEIKEVDARDRLRFWQAYVGSQRRGCMSRLLMACIRIKLWRYRQHNLRRTLRDQARRA
ncbi:MAG TPA: lipopolysaccharide kinase InaA family protein [Gemmataceae bacterium]|nr:lipopolysaccharide kinase InaA family protein [Gemmataceae bacterium]